MLIISHRGYWLEPNEKNQLGAFTRSLDQGFGIETDVRDYNGELVICHDMPNRNCKKLSDLLLLYQRYPKQPTLALNIKADGLQSVLESQLKLFSIDNYFVFDMAVPDALHYLRRGMIVYTRHSEHEPIPSCYEKAYGIWLDEFNGHWLTDDVIEKHLSAGKAICIVSPELHNRPFNKEWQHYRDLEKKIGRNRLMLCTDFPAHAMEFFNA